MPNQSGLLRWSECRDKPGISCTPRSSPACLLDVEGPWVLRKGGTPFRRLADTLWAVSLVSTVSAFAVSASAAASLISAVSVSVAVSGRLSVVPASAAASPVPAPASAAASLVPAPARRRRRAHPARNSAKQCRQCRAQPAPKPVANKLQGSHRQRYEQQTPGGGRHCRARAT